jgi:hypothetical protein
MPTRLLHGLYRVITRLIKATTGFYGATTPTLQTRADQAWLMVALFQFNLYIYLVDSPDLPERTIG